MAKHTDTEQPPVEPEEAPAPPPVIYRVKLADGLNACQFLLNGQTVELTADDPVFETEHQPTWKHLLSNPSLVEA